MKRKEKPRHRRQRKQRSIRNKLEDRDGRGCFYCSKTGPLFKKVRIVYNDGDYKDVRVPCFNIDHVIPKSQGGCDHLKNKVWSCLECNLEKASELPTLQRWRPSVEARIHINVCGVIADNRKTRGLPELEAYPIRW